MKIELLRYKTYCGEKENGNKVLLDFMSVNYSYEKIPL